MPAVPERQSRHAPNPDETRDQRRLTSDLYLTSQQTTFWPPSPKSILDSLTSITQTNQIMLQEVEAETNQIQNIHRFVVDDAPTMSESCEYLCVVKIFSNLRSTTLKGHNISTQQSIATHAKATNYTSSNVICLFMNTQTRDDNSHSSFL